MPETRDHVSLTIYNSGTSLVREGRTVSLQPGINTLDVTDVAALIEPTSVALEASSDVLILEQNYLYDLVGGEALLQRYLEEPIEVTATDGNLFTGTLLSARDGSLVLSLAGGEVLLTSLEKIRDVRFPAPPGGLITRPTLKWLLESKTGGDQAIELTYLTGGLNWHAAYNLLLTPGRQAFELKGWVTLDNHCGTTFENAKVKLLAGDVERLPTRTFRWEKQAMLASEAAQVEQREVFEYQLYELPRSVTVAQNETKQVEFVTAADVPFSTFYTYDATERSFDGYRAVISEPNYANNAGRRAPVMTWLEFTTGADGGVDRDLPAGLVRVYQADADGAAVLIGENNIGHTPRGETVRFRLGAAFDLVGEHRQTEFEQRAKTSILESFEIKLRNRKDTQAVEVRVVEHLFRWSNWKITNSSLEYTKVDAGTIEYRVTIAPNAEEVLTYTVAYSWQG